MAEEFRAEPHEGYWVVIHVPSGNVVATGLDEPAAREWAAAMRTAKPTDL